MLLRQFLYFGLQNYAVNKARGMLIMRRILLFQIAFTFVWMILNQKKVS